MLDIKFIRQKPEEVKKGVKKKGFNPKIIDQILELDRKRREYIKITESLKAKQNKLGKKDMEEARKIKAKIVEIAPNLGKTEQKFNDLMLQVPNLPLEDVPVGKNENDNRVLRTVGEKPKFDFQPKDHLELGESLNIIDIKRAAKASGTRFGCLKREAALLEFALVNLALEVAAKEGFVPIIPPALIKPKAMAGMGYIDIKEDLAERYFLEKDQLFLIGTAEQSIGPLHQGEVFEEGELPSRAIAFSTCFREEAGSYGKDTRGIFRVHQFDKVEMFSFCKPRDSKKEHQFFLEIAEKLMQSLKIPYRIVQVCTGDLARPSAATFDLEAWLPGQNRYRETHSFSNCTDFQARRLNIRFRKPASAKASAGKLEFVHTLNGTAFAIGRTLIAIIENYQQKDGSVKIPEVLQEYLKFKEIKKG
jgi:seryl-tRNA synthetase